MRSSVSATLWAVFGLATSVYANDALATITPCPVCPKSISPPPITITFQLQPVSTCTPEKTCTKNKCHLEPSCSTYDWISSSVPCLGGASTTLITKTDQIVKLSHVSTVLTSYLPCTTTAPSWNGSVPKSSSCTSTSYQTMIIDISAPFNECGPLALGNWDGSGLCKKCTPNDDTTSQVVYVSKCLDGQCSTYYDTWVSNKAKATGAGGSSIQPTEPASNPASPTYAPGSSQDTAGGSSEGSSSAEWSSEGGSSSGPSSEGSTPGGSSPSEGGAAGGSSSEASTPAWSSSSQGGSSSEGGSTPASSEGGSGSEGGHGGSGSEGSNGGSGSYGGSGSEGGHGGSSSYGGTESEGGYGGSSSLGGTESEGGYGGSSSYGGSESEGGHGGSESEGGHGGSGLGGDSGSYGGHGGHGGSGGKYTTSTIYTTWVSTITSCHKTVTNCPARSTILTTITEAVSTTVCPISPVSPFSQTTSASTGPASTGLTRTGSSTLATSTNTGYSSYMPSHTRSYTNTHTTIAPSSTPLTPSTVGAYWDFFGCVGSTDGFPTFNLVESSGSMDLEVCTSECQASGDLYAGVYTTDCYCAAALDAGTSTEAANGVCDLPCPGNSLETCGGNAGSSSKLRRRISDSILLDVYEFNLPATTSASSTETSSTSSSTPNPSSDPDPAPEKRDIQADMEISMRKSRTEIKLRRGGMLRSPGKAEAGPVLAKRDYGLKRPFGH